MLKNLYQKMMAWAAHRHARYWLMFISACESVFFPIPPDVMLLPMALADRRRALLFALYCTIGSVIGALVGYMIGYWFFDSLGAFLLETFDREQRFQEIQAMLNEQDWLIILLAAITPIPFKIATLSAGFLQMNLLTVLLAGGLGRAFRYGLVAGLAALFGARIEYFLEHHFNWAVTIGFVLFASGWLFLM